MARGAHDPADSRRGLDRRGATRHPRRRLARTVSDPARRRLVLLDLPLALADLGVRAELAVRTRVWRGRPAEDVDGAGFARARRGLLPLCPATRQNPARFLDVPQAADGFGRLVRGVGRACGGWVSVTRVFR